MAARYVTPATGAVALPTGFNGAFQSFNLTERVGVEDATIYGANVYGASLSNATPIQSGSAMGIVKTGAATTNPGFGTNLANTGGSATFTYETSTTISGTYIITELSTSHARSRGLVSCQWSFVNSADPTITWASS